MKDEECAKLLIECSYKEANLFWVRNAAISVMQTLLVGIFVGYLPFKVSGLSIEMGAVLCTFGMLLSLVHLRILVLSKRYNAAWMDAFKDLVKTKYVEDPNGNYHYLREAIAKFSPKRFSWLNTSSLFYLIPISLAIFWIWQLVNVLGTA